MHFVMQTIDFHGDRSIGTLLAEPWRDGCVGARLDNGNATMSHAINVVAISGGLQRPSRTLVLTDAIVAALGAALPIDTRLIELGEIAAGWPVR